MLFHTGCVACDLFTNTELYLTGVCEQTYLGKCYKLDMDTYLILIEYTYMLTNQEEQLVYKGMQSKIW